MKVFEFEKSLLDRLRESRNLLEVRGDEFIKASEIRHEWELYAELKMEPAGKTHHLVFATYTLNILTLNNLSI